MKPRTNITEEQKQEIVNSTLSNISLSEIYNVNKNTISRIRIKAGKGLGSGFGSGGKRHFKLTQEQIARVLTGKDRGVDLAKEFGVTTSLICRVRSKSGIKQKRTPRPKVKKEPVGTLVKVKVNEKAVIRNRNEIEKSIKLEKEFKTTTEWKLANGWAWRKGENRSMVLKKITA